MNVKLLAYTQLAEDAILIDETGDLDWVGPKEIWDCTDGQAVALTAIRTCYSSNKPNEIVEKEGMKYFGRKATDGEEGSEADRLIRMIMKSGHTSTIEHLNYTFTIEGVSRSLLAQLTRHRFFSFSVQSQRYVKFGSEDRSGGAEFVIPPSWEDKLSEEFIRAIIYDFQHTYDELRSHGVPAEDARFVLPNAAACNIVATTNLRSLLDFYNKRKKGKGGQWEINNLAEMLRKEVEKVEPWTSAFFDMDK